MFATRGAPTLISGYGVEVSASWVEDLVEASLASRQTSRLSRSGPTSSERRPAQLAFRWARTSSRSSRRPIGTAGRTWRSLTPSRRASRWLVSVERLCVFGLVSARQSAARVRPWSSSSTSPWPSSCVIGLPTCTSSTPTTCAPFCGLLRVPRLPARVNLSWVSTSRLRGGSAGSEPHSKGRSPPAPTGSDLFRIGDRHHPVRFAHFARSSPRKALPC